MDSAQEVIAGCIWNDSDLWDLDDMGAQAAADIIAKLEAAGYVIVEKSAAVLHLDRTGRGDATPFTGKVK